MSKNDKPTDAQLAALRLAAEDAIRYYKGGWYGIPHGFGDNQRAPLAAADAVSVPPQTIAACVERGWLDRHGFAGDAIYLRRWTITPAGRAVLAAATEPR